MSQPRIILLSAADIAAHLGLDRTTLSKRGELPAPDFVNPSGTRQAWLPETAEAWNREYKSRPEYAKGRGRKPRRQGTRAES
jgi:hypothetical protein